MIRALLLSFALPKFFSFYLLELSIIGQTILNFFIALSNKSKPVILISYKNGIEKLFVQIVIFSLVYKLTLLLFSSIVSGQFLVLDIIYEFKIFIYFYLFLFMANKNLQKLISTHIKFIISVHFFISILIIADSLRVYSFQDLLWRADLFGGRFVGFAGSSITTRGLEFLGSTANSMGMLYLCLLIYFRNSNSNVFFILICLFGILITFSQGAFLGLLLYAIYILYFEAKKIKTWFVFLCVILSLILINYALPFNILDRLIDNISLFINKGKIPGQIIDRLTQFYNMIYIIYECPSNLFWGKFGNYYLTCPNTYIVESYFFDQLQSYGLIGLIISFLKFFLFVKILDVRSNVNLRFFYFFWFLSNLLFYNSFETDFILMTIISITMIRRTNA